MVEVRDAVAADAGGIREVGVRTWPSTYEFAGLEYVTNGIDRWWSLDALARRLENTHVVVVVNDDRVVGTGNVDLRPEVPVIWTLYVLREWQGRGVGSKLLTAMLAKVPGPEVALEYADGNDGAARFYARHGFRETRREDNDDPEWPMTVWMATRLT